MRIHEAVLDAANAIASSRPDWTFAPDEVVQALPHLNVSSVRTHVGSRCCVNARPNHAHRWSYFKRVGRARYEVLPNMRRKSKPSDRDSQKDSTRPAQQGLRETIHVLVTKSGDAYVAECMELAVVTQARSLDELLTNIREALSLHLEGEDAAAFGLAQNPRMQLIYELPRAL